MMHSETEDSQCQSLPNAWPEECGHKNLRFSAIELEDLANYYDKHSPLPNCSAGRWVDSAPMVTNHTITRAELTAVFGEGFVYQIPERLIPADFSPEVRRLLGAVGIPHGLLDLILINSSIKKRGLISLNEIFAGSGMQPPAGSDDLFKFGVLADSLLCLNKNTGEVVLLVEGETLDIAVVNSNFELFLKFLCVLETERKLHSATVDVDEEMRGELLAKLAEFDPDPVSQTNLWRAVIRAVI